jgi:hypothetical protein
MDARAKAEVLLAEMAAAMGIPELAFDADGTLTLDMDDRFLVTLGVDEAAAALILMAPILGTEGPKPKAFLEQALVGNFMWQGTLGATLAIDEASGVVVLHRRLPLDGLSLPDLEQAIEAFVNATEAWTDLADSHAAGQGGNDPAAGQGGIRPDQFA